MADQGIVAIYELRRPGNSSISSSRAGPDVINREYARCGMLDKMLDQRETSGREPKRQNLAGVGVVVLRGSTAPALGADHLLHS